MIHSDPLFSIDAKLDSRSNLYLLNELADLHSCNNSIFLEARRHEDLYMWIARTPNGPSVKCHVQNIHTMDELKMTGNCLKGSRGIVCFDGGWDQDEHWRLLKEMITHVGTPHRPLSSHADESHSADLFRAENIPKTETIHRPHPHLFPARQQDLVPKLPNRGKGPTEAVRSAPDVVGGDWPAIRLDPDQDIRGIIWWTDRVRESR